nr:hypothetical protein HK105_004175 [Polyrhizophydium stewartii]
MSSPTNFAYSIPTGGLDIWAGFAKSIRIASRSGRKYLTFTSGSLVGNTSDLTAYYLGAGIVIAIIFLSLIFTIITCFAECCCLCCCKKSLARKKLKRVWSRKSAIISWFWYILINLVFFIAAIASFTGSSYLSTSVDSAKTGTLGTISSAQIMIDGLSPAVVTAFADLKKLVSDTADSAFNLVDFNGLTTTGVTTNMNALATGMDNTQASVDSVLAQANAISTSRSTINTQASGISSTITGQQTDFNDWVNNAQSITGSASTWKYTGSDLTASLFSNAVTAATTVSTGISNSPDTATLFNSLTTLNLRAYATNVRGIVDQLKTTILSLMTSGINGFKTTAGSALDTAKTTITGSLGTMQTSADTTLNSTYKSANDLFGQVASYNVYRHIAMSILSAFILVILIVINLGTYFGRPRVIKGFNLSISSVYVLIQLLALVLFIVALAIGDVCSAVFDYSPPPISNGLSADMKTQVINVFSFRDQCGQNKSLLDIAVNLKLVDAASVDMTTLASNQLNSIDFTPIANSWNIGSSISLSQSPTSALSSVTSFSTNGISTSGLSNLHSSGIPALRTAITNLKNGFDAAITNANSNSGLTFTPAGASAADQTAAYTAFMALLQSRSAALGAFLTATTGTLDSMDATVQDMITKINTLVSDTNTMIVSLISNANSIPALYTSATNSLTQFASDASTSISNGIPQVKSNTIAGVSTIQTKLNGNLKCTSLASNINVIQDAMSGVDAVWFSYYAIGVFAFISIPAFIYFANVMEASKRKTAAVDVEGGVASWPSSPAPKPKKKAAAKREPKV